MSTPRRKKPGISRVATASPTWHSELSELIDAATRLGEGKSLDRATARWVAELLWGMVNDQDVRSRFYRTISHRPGRPDQAFFDALDVAIREAEGSTIASAKADLAAREARDPHHAWLAHKHQARQTVNRLGRERAVALLRLQRGAAKQARSGRDEKR